MTWVLNSLSWLLGHLPLRAVHAVGAGIGALAWFFNRRKAEIRNRIRECLGVDADEANRIQRAMYRNLGYTAVETLRIPHMGEAEVRSRIRYLGTEMLPEKGTGFFALVAHTGSWELMATATPLLGLGPLHVVVKTLKPSGLNTWLCKARTRWGNKIHDRRGASRELLKVLKTQEPMAFILDQNAKRNWGVFVDFFGKPACTTDGLAQLAAISGYPIFPVFCRRNREDRTLVVEVGEEIPGPADRSPEEIHRVTTACTAAIEDFVRENPEQWIWMHRRWRTQPLAEKSEPLT
ncbi:MAG: lysophospholipid acyltransferase family protein [Kiritimatiellae bacterium]|nr:lysophospholipid acyltransferase family protein [Kiritimatiellia bacterium]